MEWYYILGIISYGIFIVQFLLSNFGGDVDLDVDFDGESDLDVSSLLSFKGLVHFAMGFSGWLMVRKEVTVFTVIVGVIIGVLFMVLLYYIYRLCMQFNSEPTEIEGEGLVGKSVKVILALDESTYICCPLGMPYREIRCHSNLEMKIGDIRHVSSYENGVYNIY